MDSKTLRLSVMAIITTVVLIGVVVYAANKDRIDSLLGSGETSESTEAGSEAMDEVSETQYGEQIGDNLKGFLTADDFFDKSEQRPSVVVVVDNVPVPANGSSEDESTDLTDIQPEGVGDEEATENDDSMKNKSSESGSDKSEESVSGAGDSEKPDEKALDGAKPEGETPPDKPEGESSTEKTEGKAPVEKTDGDAASNDSSTDSTSAASSSTGEPSDSSARGSTEAGSSTSATN